MPQTLRWLLTVREAPHASLRPGKLPVGVDILISPLRIAIEPGNDAAPPNPNCLGELRPWPSVVELRRPDGAIRSVGLRSASAHINMAYAARSERDEFGRIRNPWLSYAVLEVVQVGDVPIGSEVWGVVDDEAANGRDEPGQPA